MVNLAVDTKIERFAKEIEHCKSKATLQTLLLKL